MKKKNKYQNMNFIEQDKRHAFKAMIKMLFLEQLSTQDGIMRQFTN